MRSGQITPVHAPPIFVTKMINCDKSESALSKCCHGSYSTSYLNQISVLLKRTFIILSRDKTLTYSRLLTHTVIAIFIGILYYGIGTDASNMLNNFNFMFFSVMFLMLTAFNCITTTCEYSTFFISFCFWSTQKISNFNFSDHERFIFIVCTHRKYYTLFDIFFEVHAYLC